MKYMGSKNRIAKHILPFLQESLSGANNKYLEPFVGGANMIDKVSCDVRIGYDYNEYLIAMWQHLVSGWNPPESITREQYRDIRDNKSNYQKHLVGWVGINASYSGKWFGGYAGETKTKVGTVRDYYKEALSNVEKQVGGLSGVVFEHKDFFNLDVKGFTIYCDPPYRGTTRYKDSFDNERFELKLLQLAEHNSVFVSEYEMSNKDNFKELWSGKVKSSLSANGAVGGSVSSVEKLFKVVV